MPKRLISILVGFAFISTMLVGCASTEQNKAYEDYVKAMVTLNQQESKPLLDLELHEDGKIKKIAIHQQKPPIQIQQYQPVPHPGWRVAEKLVGVAGVVGGIWAAGNAIEGIIGAMPVSSVTNVGTGNAGTITDMNFNSRNSGSYNTAGDTATFAPSDSSSHNVPLAEEAPVETPVVETPAP